MPQRPPDVTPEIVSGDLSEDLLQAYLASPDLAVDTETMGLQTRRDRLCLVQLCNRQSRAAIVQVPALFESPIFIVASDNLGALKNRCDSNYLSHMRTWPAPDPRAWPRAVECARTEGVRRTRRSRAQCSGSCL